MNVTNTNKLNLTQWTEVSYIRNNELHTGTLAKVERSFGGEIYYINTKGICYPIHMKDVQGGVAQ